MRPIWYLVGLFALGTLTRRANPVWLASLLCLLVCAPASSDKWQHPVIQAVKVEQPPVIDGILDDPCWQSASTLEGFRYLPKKRPASEPTKVWMCYDSQACYFAFYCYDSKPAEIRARETKRNSENFWSDDWIEVNIDPTGTFRGGYCFQLNPLGAQCESVPGGASEKTEWRGDWRGAAKIVSDGWTAEYAIPFSVLRYPKGQSVFVFCLCRYIAREDEEVDWPPMPNDIWDSYEKAEWAALETPSVRHPPQVMAYTTAEIGEEGNGWHSGVDAKQVFDSNTTVLASVNPDFENVEDEVESIVFSYGERWLPERRPFFVDGRGYYSSNIFYSRRVPQFDVGVKAYGRYGDWEWGALDAWHIGDRNDLVMCGRYRFDQHSSASAGVVNAEWPGVHNTAAEVYYGYYGAVSQGDFSSGVSVAKSWSAGVGGDGISEYYGVGLWPNPGYLGWGLYYEGISSQYNPADGFVYERGYHGLSGRLNLQHKFEGRWLHSWEWDLYGHRYEAEGGGLHHSGVSGDASLATRAGSAVYIGYSSGRRPPYADRTWYAGFSWNQNHPLNSGRASIDLGKVFGGDYLYASARQGLRPSEDWALELSAAYQRMAIPSLPVDDVFQGILSANFDLDPEHTFAGRYVNRAGAHNFYVSYRQVVRKGLDAYVIIGNPNVEKTEGRLAFKLVSVF